MKSIFSFVTILFIAFSLSHAADLQLPRVSQKATVTQAIGLTDVTIQYSRPGVKERVIWGELVPYDKVWRTGANETTSIQFSTDVRINGQNLPAGTYGLHTIPGKDEWTVIFNKSSEQWGSYSYDATQDALRVKVKPKQGTHQEWMMFSFPEVKSNSGTVELAWEKVRVPFQIETDTHTKALANIKEALEGMGDWGIPYRAADYLFTAGGSDEEAMKLIDRSIALQQTYWNLRMKADMLAKAGKTKEAIATADQAVKLGKENKDEPTEIEKTEKKIATWKSQ